MSRLRRLRSFWRSSLRAGTRRPGGSVIPHRPVNLLPERSASTSMRERGTRTPVMGTSVAFSSSLRPGTAWAVWGDLTSHLRASSSTVPTRYFGGTATLGGSGEPRESAASAEQIRAVWQEARREVLGSE